MPINAGPEFVKAEKEYLNSQKVEDQIYWLEEMIRAAPKHKGSEKFLSELKTRMRKLREKSEKMAKKSGGKKGIRKEGFQFVLIGKTNSGKSLLLSKLANVKPLIADYPFTTKFPELGTFVYEGVNAQIVDNPAVGGEDFDVGISNNADCLLIVISNLDEVAEVEKYVERSRAKKIIVVNKVDLLDENERRKLFARFKTKKIDGVIISAETGEGILELKEKMFSVMGVIRIYFKEPGKEVQSRPLVLKENSTVRDAGEKIFKGFAATIKETRISGPSSKFANQKVGLTHVLKDKDVVEFHTR